MNEDLYDGPVTFVEGVHYPAVPSDEGDPDENGAPQHHADLTRPLRWVEGSTYRAAADDEPLHNDVHHQQEIEVDPSTIVVGAPGQDVYAPGVHVVSSDGKTYYLTDEAGASITDHPLEWDSAAQLFRAKKEAE